MLGTITVDLVAGTGYTVGGASRSTVTVNDTSIPALSIANADETLGGKNAEFVVTSSIPFAGSLNVVYTPETSDGDYLNVTDGTGPGPNKNSGEDRTIPLNFSKVGDNYVATLSFATVEDSTDSDNTGTITVTLKDDPANPDTYTLSATPSDQVATVEVINAPIPVLTIVSTSRSLSIAEGATAEIVIEASENPKQPVTFSYTPTETGTSYLDPLHEGATKNSGESREVTLTFTQEGQNPLPTVPWRATLSVNTQQDDALNGTITVVIDDPESGEKYTAGTEKTSTVLRWMIQLFLAYLLQMRQKS